MKNLIFIFLGVVFLGQPAFADDADEVLAIIEAQAAAWSSGDIPAFMEGYWKSDDLRFASGGNVTYGWQATLDNYQAGYQSASAMGTLTFSNLDIKLLSPRYALVFGRWDLEREIMDLGGLFTLLFEKKPEGWRIITDHTSSDDLPIATLDE